jgi:hypothetical protein
MSESQADFALSARAIAADLAATNAIMVKVGAETDSLIAKIASMQAIIDAGEGVSPELASALAEIAEQATALKATAQTADAKVEDTP